MKNLRTLGLSLLLASGVLGTIHLASPPVAHAQFIAPGGGSDACTGLDCNVKTLTASNTSTGISTPYLYTTGTTSRTAIILAPNQYMRWGGTSDSAGGCISYWNNSTGVRFDCLVHSTQVTTQWLNMQTSTVPTCDSTVEGRVIRHSGTGGTSGARTRACLCTSDGAATPAYAWQNVVTGTVGTATTCVL